jgi:4-amino-4-deoxy-L-arabinose transferase-like glycosyltransferase
MIHKLDKTVLLILFVIVSAFIGLVLYATSGLRGSDQYWYVSDVETILEGGPNVTNNIYPSYLMSRETLEKSPFIHNILNVYLVLPASMLFGAFKGWIITNMIASLLTGLMIALIVARSTDIRMAVFSFAVYLLLPLTMWQTAQPLAEATIAPFTALSMILYLKVQDNRKLWIPLTLTVCVAYYCRVSFLPVLLLLPFVYFFRSKPVNFKNCSATLALVIFVILALFLRPKLFPEANTSSWRGLLNSGIPGVTTNMHSYYCIEPLPLRLGNLISKFRFNLYHQFVPHSLYCQVFYLPFNILSILSVYLYFIAKSPVVRKITGIAVIFLLLHLMTILLVQNQFRYLLVVTPAVITGGIIMLNHIELLRNNKNRLNILCLFVGCALFASSLSIAVKLHNSGLIEVKYQENLALLFDTIIPENDTVIFQPESNYQLLGYVLKPRIVVFVISGYTPEQYQAIRKKAHPHWLICPADSKLLLYYDVDSEAILKQLPKPYEHYALFKL